MTLGPPPTKWQPPAAPPEGLEQSPGSPGFEAMIPEVSLLLCVVPTRLATWRARGVGPRFCRATPASNSAILYSRAEVAALREDIDRALREQPKADVMRRTADAAERAREKARKAAAERRRQKNEERERREAEKAERAATKARNLNQICHGDPAR